MPFPAGPYLNGATHTENGTNYVYSAAVGGWNKVPVTAGVPASRLVNTLMSLDSGGDLTTDRIIQLDSDSVAPAPNYYYGTDSTGVKSWYPLPTGLIWGSCSINAGVLNNGAIIGPASDIIDNGVTISNNASNQIIISVLAGKTYHLSVACNVPGALYVGMILENAGTGASIVTGSGILALTYAPTADTNLRIKYVGGIGNNPRGTITIYSR